MKYRSILLIVIILASTVPVQTQENIKVVFEDPGLEKAIRDAINKPSGDIYDSHLKELDAVGKEIKCLEVIKHCTALKKIRLNKNQISDISPLAAITTLELLLIYSNPLNKESKNVVIPILIMNKVQVEY